MPRWSRRNAAVRSEARFYRRGVVSAAFVGLAAALLGCSGPASPSFEPKGKAAQEIKNGTLASNYPEAVTVAICQTITSTGCDSFEACSGSLIAPSVVMTAGHCVYGCFDDSDPNCTGQIFPGWGITAPFASGQIGFSTSGMVNDWTVTAAQVDGSEHDIGLIFLDAPISIATYPTLASQPIADGDPIVNIGRVLNGTVTDQLYEGAAVNVSYPPAGYLFDYQADDVVESGDSGGPDVVPGTHVIAAVNSGAAQNFEVLARVDLLFSWIQTQVQNHGGSSVTGTTGATGAGGGGAETCTSCETAAESGACSSQLLACEESATCVALAQCLEACPAGSATCINGCASANPGGVADYNAFGACLCMTACPTVCASECGSPSSGSGGAGGAATTTTSTSSATATSATATSSGGAGVVSQGGATASGGGGNGGGDSANASDQSGGCDFTEGPASTLEGAAFGLFALALGRRRRASKRS